MLIVPPGKVNIRIEALEQKGAGLIASTRSQDTSKLKNAGGA
jgi:hypothetical protein